MQQTRPRPTRFDFRADFSATPPAPGQVSLTAPELAGLIAEVRAQTLAEVARQEAASALDRVDAAAAALRGAGRQLIEILSLLETVQLDQEVSARVRPALVEAARRLVDGQGDLFAAAEGLNAVLDKSPRCG